MQTPAGSVLTHVPQQTVSCY